MLEDLRLESLSILPNAEVSANDTKMTSCVVSSSASPEISAPGSPPQIQENPLEMQDIDTLSDSREDIEEEAAASASGTQPALGAQAVPPLKTRSLVPFPTQAPERRDVDTDLFVARSQGSGGLRRRIDKATASGKAQVQAPETLDASRISTTLSNPPKNSAFLTLNRRPSFGLSFLSSLSNSIRGASSSSQQAPKQENIQNLFMANSPTIANLSNFANGDLGVDSTLNNLATSRLRNPDDVIPEHTRLGDHPHSQEPQSPLDAQDHQEANDLEPQGETAPRHATHPSVSRENTLAVASDATRLADIHVLDKEDNGKDKDGLFSVRLTPIIDHSSSNTGLYFSPIIRRNHPSESISIGRYTEKHKSAAHAPQGSNSRIVFKSKVVSRTHALFQCNEEGQWFLKDCKSSSGTFLNNIRLSQASQELTLWPLMDGDVVQLGLDYRGGTEEVYRCVKMRCEFNRSWQRKINRFNMDIHKKMKNLGVESKSEDGEEFSECAICLLKLEPCQALFVSPCSHSWHYKCIRPIIIKRYPQFYCPNCRSICDLETDIEDEDED